jgi:ubiquinone biosynthesis protein UbiJ
MEREELLRLAERAGILPWVRHEWTGKEFVHTDEGMEGDLASLWQFATLVKEQERERAAMICHQLRDVEYPADDIATRIMAKT